MSTAAVTPTSIYHELQTYYQTRKSDLADLGNALQSGSLSDAQKAYDAIVALGQSGPFAGGAPFRLSQREQDFEAVGKALQAGDLAGAQQAFAKLEATFHHNGATPSSNPAPQASAGPEIVINIGGPASTDTTSAPTYSPTAGSSASTTGTSSTGTTGTSSSGTASTAATSASSAGASPEIVINLNNSGNTPEQVVLSFNSTSNGAEQLTVSAQQGTQSPEQVTFNFNPGSREQIVLNLLNSVAGTSATPQTSSLSATA